MIDFEHGIIGYTDRYLLARHVSTDYAKTLRARIEAFCEWAEADVPIASVCCELGNEWLTDLADSGMSAWSLVGYRGALLTIWTDAYPQYNKNPPLGLKRFRRPQLVVEAYTHAEISALLKLAALLPGRHDDGNRESTFWLAAIHVAYCCGPRRGDLLNTITWRHVTPGNVLSFVQHKTGYPVRAVLSKPALNYSRKLRSNSEFILPWPYGLDWFSRKFSRIREAAGVARGTFKWIRRSAGSYAERQQRGSGANLLGHRDESVFRRFYNDQTISGEAPVQPPPLESID